MACQKVWIRECPGGPVVRTWCQNKSINQYSIDRILIPVAEWPPESYFNLLSLSFFICKVGNYLSRQDIVKKVYSVCKFLNMALGGGGWQWLSKGWRDKNKGHIRQWHPTPVLLPGKSHGRRSLVGCSPWGREESDTTEWLHFHFSLSCIGEGNGNPLQCSCLENPSNGSLVGCRLWGHTELDTTEVT